MDINTLVQVFEVLAFVGVVLLFMLLISALDK